jgi:WD40 repeat protein
VESFPTPTEPAYQTPTQTPVTLAGSGPYDFPAWLKDLHTPVLMQALTHETGETFSTRLAFLNASTGEWFEVPFPADVRYYFWFGAANFGFLAADFQSMTLFDLNSGYGLPFPVPEGAAAMVRDYGFGPQALQIRRRPSVPDLYFFQPVDQPDLGAISAYGHYSAVIDRDTSGNPLTITERASGVTVWQSSLTDGLWESEFAWSPVSDKTFALVRGTPENAASSLVTKNTFLQVIDVRTGNVKAEIHNDIGSIRWSPDGSRILYEDVFSRYSTLGYTFVGPPCIFDIRDGQRRCLSSIPKAHVPAGSSLVTTGLYTWSPDGFSVRYMMLYENQATSLQAGNVCIYNLVDGGITCPTEGLVEPHGWGISGYDFSPDGQYLSFCYSENNIGNDFIGAGYDALLRLADKNLVTWQNMDTDGLPQCSYSRQAWRPLP